MDNVDIAKLLDEVADLLEIKGENQFRVRAYRTAARTLESLGESAESICRDDPNRLTKLPGIGKDLAGKIADVVHTGRCAVLEDLAAALPRTLVEMVRIAGVGPKRAKLLYDQLGIRTIEELEQAAKDGKLGDVRGFGDVLVAHILQGCAEHHARRGRYRLSEADAHAEPLVAWLRRAPGVEKVEVAGSLRRRKETIGDLDVLVATTRPEVIAARLAGYAEVREVLAKGETKCAVVLRSGIQVDVRAIDPETWGAALHYFTGSKAHNIAVRLLGVKRGLKISEYGVFRGDTRIGGLTEQDVFRAVGLPWIPPELREDRGEIDAAREGALPRLVEQGDLRGDLHVHTTATDGANTLREMVEAARGQGYAYVAITDHTQAVRVAGGLGPAELRAQAREIHALRDEVPDITVLHGAEVDIREDGRLDLDDRTLDELDVVVAAVDSAFGLAEPAMTERVLRAMHDPRTAILAHPTGRLLGSREPYAIDLEKIVRAARELGVLLEVDAQPDRLDLNDVAIRMAKDAGVKLVVDSDAHRVGELDGIRYGVDQARRGWCAAADVANTLPLRRFLALLRDGAHRPGPRARGGPLTA
jgi:DNA polymerase (family 10)